MSNNPLISLNIATDAAPGAVPKVVENGVLVGVRSTDGNVYPTWNTGTAGPVGAGTDVGDTWTWDGNIWIPGRDAIRPNIDPSGATYCDAAVNAALLSRRGAWVHIGDGQYKFSGSINLQPHGALTGSHHSHGLSSQFVDYPNRGTQLRPMGLGKFIVGAVDATLDGFEIFYPGQNTNSAPIVYGETISVPADAHIMSILNVAAANPYHFIRIGQLTAPYAANGCRIDNIIGFPLARGITQNRNADVNRITNVHFKNFSSLHGSTLLAWVQANQTAFLVDGPEQAHLEGCFAYGGNIFMEFADEDGDAFRGVYLDCVNCSFDQYNIGIHLAANQMLTARGAKFHGGSFIPIGGAGIGVLCEDSVTPSQLDHYPLISLLGTSFSGSTHAYPIKLASGSNAIVLMSGGSAQQFAAAPARCESATGTIVFRDVVRPTAAPPIENPGGGDVRDLNPIRKG